jgi:hypothetical protein
MRRLHPLFGIYYYGLIAQCVIYGIVLTGCGYAGPTTPVSPASMANLSPDEMARRYPKAGACVQDEGGFWPAIPQRLMTGPGFEACPGLIAQLKTQYERDVATRKARQETAVAQAEADDLARRRQIIADDP